MIIRVLHEGQYRVDGVTVEKLKAADRELVARLGTITEAEFAATYQALLKVVRREGERLADGEIVESDLILPAADTRLEEAKAMFDPIAKL